MEELQKDFISKDKILKYLSQEQIFKMVFGFMPVVDEYVISPFREDNEAGCWFSYDGNGVLKFTDFANSDVITGINMMNIDCFNAIQVYYKLPNFYKTLEFLKDRIINEKLQKEVAILRPESKKERVKISIKSRSFTLKDKRFWQSYGISKQNLIRDKVLPVKVMRLLNTKNGDIIQRLDKTCYAYTNFPEHRKKLYFPFEKGYKRFITNCTQDDVGEILSLPMVADTLVISKSYKDCRVLKNMGYHSVWIQNEGMIPSNEILIALGKRFKHIAVFFDNDKAGIEAGKKLTKKINILHRFKAFHVYLPEELNKERGISDPSDMYKKKGPKHLANFLKNNI